jgi:hypothetical protein
MNQKTKRTQVQNILKVKNMFTSQEFYTVGIVIPGPCNCRYADSIKGIYFHLQWNGSHPIDYTQCDCSEGCSCMIEFEFVLDSDGLRIPVAK